MKSGKPAPSKARRAHAMNRDDEIEARKDGREAGDKDGEPGFNDIGITADRAVRSVEGPTGVDTAGEHAVQEERASDDVEIPTQKVDAREGEIFGADHQRHKKIAEYGGHDGDQKEKDHDHAMHGERPCYRCRPASGHPVG
jgi:hypothetical protein